MRRLRIAIVCSTALVLAFCVFARTAHTCPGCPGGGLSLTLSEQVSMADAVVFVRWVEGTKHQDQTPGSTTYEVVRVAKLPLVQTGVKPTSIKSSVVKPATQGNTGAASLLKSDKSTAAQTKTSSKSDTSKKSDPKNKLPLIKKGDRITQSRYRPAKKGDLFLLLGSRGSAIEWGSPMEATEASYNYLVKAPSPKIPTTKRLAYFLKYLEFPEKLVARDAYTEFANAPYKDIVPLAKQMPRERIRGWILNPKTPAHRLGLYGLLLGMCGTEEDAKALAQKIVETNEDFRLGMDGVMAGYLMLTGDKGLTLIDETKLRAKPGVPFSETYAAVQALRIMWTYGDGRIEKERLRQSMRLLLDRPDLADLVIVDLARWKDWSVQDRLMELYGKGKYDIPAIKRAIVRFMLVSTKFTPSGKNAEPPEHVKNGKKHMKTLREIDPKTVRDAEERFFFAR